MTMLFRCYEDEDRKEDRDNAVTFDAPDPRTAAEVYPKRLVASLSGGLYVETPTPPSMRVVVLPADDEARRVQSWDWDRDENDNAFMVFVLRPKVRWDAWCRAYYPARSFEDRLNSAISKTVAAIETKEA